MELRKLLLGEGDYRRIFMGVALVFFLVSTANFAVQIYTGRSSPTLLFLGFLFLLWVSLLTAVLSSHLGGGVLTSVALVAAPFVGGYVVVYVYLNFGTVELPHPLGLFIGNRFVAGESYANAHLNLHLTEIFVLGTGSYFLGKGLDRLSGSWLGRHLGRVGT